MVLLNGKEASEQVKENLKLKTQHYFIQYGRAPHLAAILVGNNGASETYVNNKVKNCHEIGFESTLIRLPETITEKELLEAIHQLNQNSAIDGFIVQLPLPQHIHTEKIIEAIHPDKDVDGFHPANAGRLMLGMPAFIPATPYGILLLLAHYNIETKGKLAVIIGRSNIVGRPLSVLLSSNIPQGNCTVILCHSHTKNLETLCLQADIVVAALGKPGFLKGNMVKEGAVVIDVGITRVPDANTKKGFRIQGDVAFDEVAPKASAITPVPGGVGVMTITGLLSNTMTAYEKRFQIKV